jgi:ribosomal protein L19E
MSQAQVKPTYGRRGPQGHRMGAWHQRANQSDAVVRAARALRQEGKTYMDIGQALGVPWLTVRDWCTGRTRADA